MPDSKTDWIAVFSEGVLHPLLFLYGDHSNRSSTNSFSPKRAVSIFLYTIGQMGKKAQSDTFWQKWKNGERQSTGDCFPFLNYFIANTLSYSYIQG